MPGSATPATASSAKGSTPIASRLGWQLVGGNNRTRHNREIERKFLVEWLPDNFKRSRRFIIEQGYLATESAGRQVRLRKTNKTASLTFKVGRGSHREEREIKLSPKQFAALWPGTAGRRLRKVRYEIPWERCADRAGHLSGTLLLL